MKDRTHPIYRYIFGPPAILLILFLCWAEAVHPIQIGDRTILGLWLLPLLLLVGWIGIQETLRLMRRIDSDPPSAIVYFFGTLILLAPFFLPYSFLFPKPSGGSFFSVFLLSIFGVIGVILAQMWRYPGPESRGATLRGITGGVFAIIYVPLLLSFTTFILLVPRMGISVLCGMILLVKTGDMGAYFVGRLLGKKGTDGLPKHPMSPILSPKKSMEGLCGAIVVPVLVAGIFLAILPQFSSLEKALFEIFPYGRITQYVLLCVSAAMLGLVGMLGDLAESLLKREAGVKDSSEWLPGFGGVLDMIDSVLFAAPITYAVLYVLSHR